MQKSQNFQTSRTPNNTKEKNKNLEERLQEFFTEVARLCKSIRLDARTNRVISQLLASSGSIAANYAEASEAMSKKDFIKCLKISRKEAKETLVWLKGLKVISDTTPSKFDELIQECKEFIYIFTSILSKVDRK